MEERYTGAWYRWLPETFSKAFEVHVIDGVTLVDSVEEGAFLDINSTLYYKAGQLAQVARLFHERRIHTGDVFWISDIEFWGMESIRYLARLQGIDIGIYGFLHAGSYIDCDYMAPMADIGEWMEPGWVAACDKVFLGTEFHRDLFIRKRLGNCVYSPIAKKLVVTGNPWRTDEARAVVDSCAMPLLNPRPHDILFPHRPDKEKQPGVFVDLLLGTDYHKNMEVVFTTGREQYRSTNDPDSVARIMQLVGAGNAFIKTNLKPSQYYMTCRQSKVTVSTALEETFGYAMVEAMAQGSFPLMPNRLSYPELVQGDHRFLYNDEAEFYLKLGYLHGLDDSVREEVVDYARAFDGAEDRILKEMTGE